MPLFSVRCLSSTKLIGKTALVTGCNTGIGKETVLDFFKRGARVIMACRSLERGEKAKSEIEKTCQGMPDTGNIIVAKCDLTSLKSVREFGQYILDTEPQINILINNAGVMMCPKGETEDGFEIQFGTNHLAHFLLTCILLPRIRNSKPARIVTLSSRAHSRYAMNFDDLNYKIRPYNAIEAYAQSKLANVLFSRELAKGLKVGDMAICKTCGVSMKYNITRHLRNKHPIDYKKWQNIKKINGELTRLTKKGTRIPTRRGWVKQYLQRTDINKYRCELCHNTLTMRRGDYSNFKRHIRLKHPYIYEQEMREYRDTQKKRISETEENTEDVVEYVVEYVDSDETLLGDDTVLCALKSQENEFNDNDDLTSCPTNIDGDENEGSEKKYGLDDPSESLELNDPLRDNNTSIEEKIENNCNKDVGAKQIVEIASGTHFDILDCGSFKCKMCDKMIVCGDDQKIVICNHVMEQHPESVVKYYN